MHSTPHAPPPDQGSTPSPTVILFDGVCNVCSGFVQFVIRRDPGARFQFGALQSDEGKRLLSAMQQQSRVETMVLVEDGRVYTRSAAALRIARGLRFPWPLAYALIAVPPVLRDLVYDFFARHRYQWFGRSDRCLVPTPDMQHRFIH